MLAHPRPWSDRDRPGNLIGSLGLMRSPQAIPATFLNTLRLVAKDGFCRLVAWLCDTFGRGGAIFSPLLFFAGALCIVAKDGFCRLVAWLCDTFGRGGPVFGFLLAIGCLPILIAETLQETAKDAKDLIRKFLYLTTTRKLHYTTFPHPASEKEPSFFFVFSLLKIPISSLLAQQI
jgi:hypothetical protein